MKRKVPGASCSAHSVVAYILTLSCHSPLQSPICLVTSRNVRFDMLHVLFVNGVLAHVMGSLLHYTCWFDKPGGHHKVAPAKRLSILFIQNTRFTHLTLSMFCNPKQPLATHPMLHCKGAECKHLVKPLLAVLRKMLKKGRHIHNNMLSCLQSISDLIDLWDSCGMFLSCEWKKAMGSCHIVAKHHMGWHMCLDSRHQNPRFSASWKGEGFVGKMSRLCHLCSFGTQTPPQVTRHASCAPAEMAGTGKLACSPCEKGYQAQVHGWWSRLPVKRGSPCKKGAAVSRCYPL